MVYSMPPRSSSSGAQHEDPHYSRAGRKRGTEREGDVKAGFEKEVHTVLYQRAFMIGLNSIVQQNCSDSVHTTKEEKLRETNTAQCIGMFTAS